MTAANRQSAIQTTRQAYTAMMVAYETYLIARDQYVSLGLDTVEDIDFDDDLTAQQFTDAADDMATIMTAFTPAIKVNLRTAKL